MVPVSSRTAAGRDAPSSLPISACAAMARASRAKARKVKTVIASWWAARLTGPWAVTTTTVARIAMRRLSVRSISHEPTLVRARMPRQSGSRDTPWLRALRWTMAT